MHFTASDSGAVATIVGGVGRQRSERSVISLCLPRLESDEAAKYRAAPHNFTVYIPRKARPGQTLSGLDRVSRRVLRARQLPVASACADMVEHKVST